MTYLYRSGSESLEREFVGDAPETFAEGGRMWVKAQILFTGGIHAYTPVGEAADRIAARHYRCNKEVAEGLANGTYDPPEDRGTTGVGQPRESVRQFNEMYRDAKEKAGKPLIG